MKLTNIYELGGVGVFSHVAYACKCQMALSVSEFDKRNQTVTVYAYRQAKPSQDKPSRAWAD